MATPHLLPYAGNVEPKLDPPSDESGKPIVARKRRRKVLYTTGISKMKLVAGGPQ